MNISNNDILILYYAAGLHRNGIMALWYVCMYVLYVCIIAIKIQITLLFCTITNKEL
jgi:hypothetical protein